MFTRSADCWHFTWEEHSGSFLFDQLMIMCYAILDDDKMKTEASPLFPVFRKHQISLVLPWCSHHKCFTSGLTFFRCGGRLKCLSSGKRSKTIWETVSDGYLLYFQNIVLCLIELSNLSWVLCEIFRRNSEIYLLQRKSLCVISNILDVALMKNNFSLHHPFSEFAICEQLLRREHLTAMVLLVVL